MDARLLALKIRRTKIHLPVGVGLVTVFLVDGIFSVWLVEDSSSVGVVTTKDLFTRGSTVVP